MVAVAVRPALSVAVQVAVKVPMVAVSMPVTAISTSSSRLSVAVQAHVIVPPT